MISELEDIFSNYMSQLIAKPVDNICVATSGGSDSMALTVLAKKWADEKNISLISVTVDHKLREESAEEAMKVHDICHSIGINHIIANWRHEHIRNGQIESAARKARYEILANICKKYKSNYLLVGHNLEDQIETFFMRKTKNSSNFGLACMSAKRTIDSTQIELLRPCLMFSKKILQEYLVKNKVHWFDDPMNNDDSFMRVQARKRINMLSAQEKLSIHKNIVNLGIDRRRIDFESVNFLSSFTNTHEHGFASVKLDALNAIETEIKINVLQRIIKNIGGKEYSISPVKCSEMIKNNLSGNAGNVELKKRQNILYLVRENRGIKPLHINNGEELIWDNRFFVKSKLSGLVSNLGNYKSFNNLPSYVVVTLPSLWIDSKLPLMFNSCDDFNCKFLQKIDYLDVFYLFRNYEVIL